jgi:hypothetical protein
MKTRAEFARAIAGLTLSHVDRAVALLWYYRHTQEYEERSASELAGDLHDEGFPKPNVTRLASDLKRSASTVRGKRQGTFQVDVRRLKVLDDTYLPILGARQVKVVGAVLTPESVAGTRPYLEKLVHQINGAYDYGFFDACAVLCRRLMESLVIEIYLSRGRHGEIQQNGVFVSLDRLLARIKGDGTLALGRATPKTMDEVKQIGDTAAHDRTYITQQGDIDDLKSRYRKLISELLVLAGIQK